MPTDFDAHFTAFLESTVNLKQHRLDQLDARVSAITNAFKKDAQMGSLYKEHLPQGSWAHRTIIDPVTEYDEFDADILLHLENVPEWNDNPKMYLQQVRAAFKRTSQYKDKLKRKNRCVRISYANDCHVDVVPAITLENGNQAIIFYRDNVFEDTNPVGFADWMKERDDISGGPAAAGHPIAEVATRLQEHVHVPPLGDPDRNARRASPVLGPPPNRILRHTHRPRASPGGVAHLVGRLPWKPTAR